MDEKYEALYKAHIRWLQSLLTSAQKAEKTIMKTYTTRLQNLINTQNDAKNGDAGARNRVPLAQKSFNEIEKIRDANWSVIAVLELIATKTVSEERRMRVLPTILEWIQTVEVGK